MEYSKSHLTLMYSFLCGALYFLLVSVAHFFEIKIPVLFIYYDVKSFEYQNKIISFLAFGWSAFFYLGYALLKARLVHFARFQLFAGFVAICVFVFINGKNSEELRNSNGGNSLFPYWLATLFLFLYWVWIFVFYIVTISQKSLNQKK